MEKKKRINSRNKGNSRERELAKMFREEFGFDKCQTSRYASRILDNSKCDLANIPFNLQSKIGYEGVNMKYNEIFQEMSELLEKNFTKDNPQIKYPKIIFHNINGKKKENDLVIMTFEDWKRLYSAFLQLSKFTDNLIE
jgi:hypothetical protein